MQQYIFNDDKKLFSKIDPFLKGKILKVGNGLGYLSSFISGKHKNLEVIDIEVNKLSKNKVKIYNGLDFPYKDKAFDCSLCIFVLHHTRNPLKVISEMKRVSKRIIILEETYDSFLSKIDLVYRDLYVNGLANQTCKIHWNNYFRTDKISKILSRGDFKIIKHSRERKRRYWKEFFVLER